MLHHLLRLEIKYKKLNILHLIIEVNSKFLKDIKMNL